MNTWMTFQNQNLDGDWHEMGIRVYDGPDQEGKYRYEMRWLRDGREKGQFFHAKLPEQISPC